MSIAASDGLQVRWMLNPGEVDTESGLVPFESLMSDPASDRSARL
jgi:hypothetical protein